MGMRIDAQRLGGMALQQTGLQRSAGLGNTQRPQQDAAVQGAQQQQQQQQVNAARPGMRQRQAELAAAQEELTQVQQQIDRTNQEGQAVAGMQALAARAVTENLTQAERDELEAQAQTLIDGINEDAGGQSAGNTVAQGGQQAPTRADQLGISNVDFSTGVRAGETSDAFSRAYSQLAARYRSLSAQEDEVRSRIYTIESQAQGQPASPSAPSAPSGGASGAEANAEQPVRSREAALQGLDSLRNGQRGGRGALQALRGGINADAALSLLG